LALDLDIRERRSRRNQAIHEIDIAAVGPGRGLPVSVCLPWAAFHVRRNDQETPNTLNGDVLFRGVRRQAEDDGSGSPPLDHQSRGGTWHWRLRASGVPPAGLTSPATKQAATTPAQPLGPKDAKTNTIGNIFYGSNGYLAVDGLRRVQDVDNGSSGTRNRSAKLPEIIMRIHRLRAQPPGQDTFCDFGAHSGDGSRSIDARPEEYSTRALHGDSEPPVYLSHRESFGRQRFTPPFARSRDTVLGVDVEGLKAETTDIMCADK